MSLPSLTDADAFAVRYGRSLSEDETERIEALLGDASDMVRDIAGEDYVDDAGDLEEVPPAIISVVCEAVRRAFDNPAGLQGETTGNYTWRGPTPTGSGVHLTMGEKRIIRRAAGRLGVGVVTLEGYLTTVSDDQFLADAGGGDSIMYFSDDDL